jgi:preprotein translocase subunit SecY
MVGAIYLVVVCLIPELLMGFTGLQFYFGGTSLLIIVSVTLDTVAQLQGHLMSQQYGKLLSRTSLRGGKK